MGWGIHREDLNKYYGSSYLQRLLTSAWLAIVHTILSHIIKSTIQKFYDSKIETHSYENFSVLWELQDSLGLPQSPPIYTISFKGSLTNKTI